MNISKFVNFNFKKKNYSVSYSQTGEDLIIEFLFKRLGINKPSYLDIGANHPIYLSNTYKFYKNGSCGVLVEPNNNLCKLLTKIRKRDKCVQAGVGVEGENSCNFYMLSSNSLNTTVKSEVKKILTTNYFGKQNISKIETIKLIPINNILNSYFKNTKLNLLSLDVEGSEEKIIKEFNFKRYSPEILCVETLEFTSKSKEYKNKKLIKSIIGKGYQIYADTYINTIFVQSSKI